MNLVSIGPGNGLSPVRRQAIAWTNTHLLSIWHPGTNLIAILTQTENFSFMKMPRLRNCGHFFKERWVNTPCFDMYTVWKGYSYFDVFDAAENLSVQVQNEWECTRIMLNSLNNDINGMSYDVYIQLFVSCNSCLRWPSNETWYVTNNCMVVFPIMLNKHFDTYWVIICNLIICQILTYTIYKLK